MFREIFVDQAAEIYDQNISHRRITVTRYVTTGTAALRPALCRWPPPFTPQAYGTA